MRRDTVVIALVWVVLIGATTVAYVERGAASRWPMVVIAVATVLKVALVVSVYMEIAHAARWLQALCLAWLIALAAVIGTVLTAPDWIARVL